MKEFSYLSQHWLPVENVVNTWKALFPKVKIISLSPSYCTINSKSLLPSIISTRMECFQFNFVGEYIGQNSFLSHFTEIFEKGLEFRDIHDYIGFTITYSFIEKNIKTKIKYANNVSIWLNRKKTQISLYFGDFSRFKEPQAFSKLLSSINEKTDFTVDPARLLVPSSSGLDIKISNNFSAFDLKKNIKQLIEIIGVEKFLRAEWELWGKFTMGYNWTGIQCYNRGIELQIPAESYHLEIVCDCPTFDSLEEIRPLYGPTDYSACPLGEMRFEKRIKMTFRLFFGALGYRLMLTTNRPLHGPDGDPLTPELRDRLAAAGLDLETCYADDVLFEKGPAT